MRETRHREVGEYLRRLQRLMHDIPHERRDEILSEIEEHISERLSELPEVGAAEVRNVLERLGDPEDIAADARERFGRDTAPTRRLSRLPDASTGVHWGSSVAMLRRLDRESHLNDCGAASVVRS